MKLLRLLNCSVVLLSVLLFMSSTGFSQTVWTHFPIYDTGVVYAQYYDSTDDALYVAEDAIIPNTHNGIIYIYRINNDETIDTLPQYPVQNQIRCITRWQGKLYFGGRGASFVFENGNTWRRLDSNIIGGDVWDFYPYQGKLLMSGQFDTGNWKTLNVQTCIVEYDGNTFRNFRGCDSVIRPVSILGKMLEYKGDLIVTGNFDPYPPKDSRYKEIIRWTGTKWAPLGNGIPGVGNEMVYDLAINRGYLYVGGIFKESTGGPGNNIARWDGTSWSRLLDGVQPNSGVQGIMFQGDTLNVVGPFQKVNGQPCSVFARYYNNKWCYNTSVSDGSAICLALFKNKVIVGGAMGMQGFGPFSPLARLDGDDCFKTVGVGRTEEPISDLVYPNPANDRLFIKSAGIKSISILDIQGRLIIKSTDYSSATGMDVSKLASGLYQVLIGKGDSVQVTKLVKK